MQAQRYVVLAVAQLSVGAAAIFARFALAGAPALAVAACRLAIASAILLLLAALSTRHDAPAAQTRGERAIFAFAGIALAVHFATWIWSLQFTAVAASTLLVATTPVWTALYDAVARKRGLSRIAIAAMAAGAAGLVLVVLYSGSRAPVGGHRLLGDALALAGGIAIAAYFVLIREVRGNYGTQAIVTRTYTWAAAALIVAAAVARAAPPALSDTRAWGGIIAMALVSQLLGHTALNAALRWFSPSAVAFTTLLEPAIAAALAFAIFGERLGAPAIAGSLVLLGAIAVFLREETTLPA